ncbi:MAG: hypothetical protein A3D67_00735 [Candidatus Lloydbacteria bacterium RIFCSPHIGHO2_02_FULL_51_22]|uniref:Uncharacterized protein n=2 Tax=Candidatus Lloydiibacteriota TaxID=1817910 RepID=A0A1G2DHX6_9BACT|nr:MAG: hypothetical protein A3D67_00735 [Candidatus Lloydbacteria bacterium RIFCSPHIGHO2_02_FULL_51_22]
MPTEIGMFLFNTNGNVEVRLTEEGYKAYDEYRRRTLVDVSATTQSPDRNMAIKAIERILELKKDAEGWHTFQLADLMCIFGPGMRMGPPMPFVGNVIRIPRES